MNKIDKLLAVLKKAFNLTEFPTSIKEVLQSQRDLTEDKEEFVCIFSGTFCGRSNNEFVDYELLAIYLKRLLAKMPPSCDFSIRGSKRDVSEEIIYRLFFDDRHDCCQNVPFILHEFVEKNSGIINPQDFWMAVSDCFIDAFNADGTGDSRIK